MGVHSCVVLAWLDDRAQVASQRLPAAHELPATDLNVRRRGAYLLRRFEAS